MMNDFELLIYSFGVAGAWLVLGLVIGERKWRKKND